MTARAAADVIIERTGVPSLVLQAMRCNAGGGIVCLAGLSNARTMQVDVGPLDTHLVLENDVVFGTALARVDRPWLERLITRRVPVERLEARDDDVKLVIDFAGTSRGAR